MKKWCLLLKDKIKEQNMTAVSAVKQGGIRTWLWHWWLLLLSWYYFHHDFIFFHFMSHWHITSEVNERVPWNLQRACRGLAGATCTVWTEKCSTISMPCRPPNRVLPVYFCCRMAVKRYLAFAARDQWDVILILWRERHNYLVLSFCGKRKSLPALTKRVFGTECTHLVRMKQQEKKK